MLWYQFKLNSGNFVIVRSSDKKAAQNKFKDVWPGNSTKVVDYGEHDEPYGAVETLEA